MNKKSLLRIFYLFLSSILLVSCSWPLFPDKEEKFKEIVPNQNMNTILKFFIPVTTVNTFKIGDNVDLELINHSNQTIYFYTDYGLELYYYEDGTHNWIKVLNNIHYLPSEPHPSLPPNKPNDFNVLGVTINPLFDRFFAQVTVRIVVKGYIKQSDPSNDEFVGAYIDVPLHQ